MMDAPEAAQSESHDASPASCGPRDDFFCWKFEIWYPSEDCVYRHTHRTYAACASCFQGRMNARHIERGLQPPVIVPRARANG